MTHGLPDPPPADGPAAPARPSRRRALFAGAAVVAAAGGVGTALRQLPRGVQDGGGSVSPTFWARSLAGPDGRPIALATLRGKPAFVNFWASWCAPCVRELPRLSTAARITPHWHWLAWAVDQPEAVQAFAARHAIGMPVGIDATGGFEAMVELGNAAGGLPFSVLIDADGSVIARHLGEMNDATLRQWLGLRPRP